VLQEIETKTDAIAALCRRYRVQRLELFGSAVGERFDAKKSDFDFLVEFEPLQAGQHADCYFGLLEGLEDTLGRRIDLIMTRAIKNPYFLEAIQPSRTLLYAA
jgi:predicted nucleotidyltransferase